MLVTFIIVPPSLILWSDKCLSIVVSLFKVSKHWCLVRVTKGWHVLPATMQHFSNINNTNNTLQKHHFDCMIILKVLLFFSKFRKCHRLQEHRCSERYALYNFYKFTRSWAIHSLRYMESFWTHWIIHAL